MARSSLSLPNYERQELVRVNCTLVRVKCTAEHLLRRWHCPRRIDHPPTFISGNLCTRLRKALESNVFRTVEEKYGLMCDAGVNVLLERGCSKFIHFCAMCIAYILLLKMYTANTFILYFYPFHLMIFIGNFWVCVHTYSTPCKFNIVYTLV